MISSLPSAVGSITGLLILFHWSFDYARAGIIHIVLIIEASWCILTVGMASLSL